jgi:hypothetical protein
MFLLSVFREMPGGRMAGKLKRKTKIVALARRKKKEKRREDDSCRIDAPQLR